MGKMPSIINKTLLTSLFHLPLLANTHVLLGLKEGRVEEALTACAQQATLQNIPFLQEVALAILRNSMQQEDPEEQLRALLGASISWDERCFCLLEAGIQSKIPQVQLITVSLLAKAPYEKASSCLRKAAGSLFLPIRLEALYALCQRHEPEALSQIESLLCKMDPILAPLACQMLALLPEPSATSLLRQLLAHPKESVRTAALLATLQSKRDELLPEIRRVAAQPSVRAAEVAAFALGLFKDRTSIERLYLLSASPHETVRTATWQALASLNEKKALENLTQEALKGNLFAIWALRTWPTEKNQLLALLKAETPFVALNASLALFEQQEPASLPFIGQLLRSEVALINVTSPGGALHAWKTNYSVLQEGEEGIALIELSTLHKTALIDALIHWPTKVTLPFLQALVPQLPDPLIPAAIAMVAQINNPQAIALLKEWQQRPGAPWIRAYATLHLARLHEEAHYIEQLSTLIHTHAQEPIVAFRPFIPVHLRMDTSFALTPEQSAQFVSEGLEVLAAADETFAITLLLKLLANSAAENRPLFAGFLLRLSG